MSLRACYGYCCRYAEYQFDSTPLTKKEQKAVSHLSKAVQGFLVWRRTLLVPCAVLLLVATAAQAVLIGLSYAGGFDKYLEELVGTTLWNEAFCPKPHFVISNKRKCTADFGFMESVYYVVLGTDVVLILINLVGCALMLLAAARWADYRLSSRTLRTGFGASFIAPFTLLLLLPPAAFINGPAAQTALCEAALTKFVAASSPDLAATLNSEVCAKPIAQWSDAINKTLVEAGRVRNRTTGTCPYAEAVIMQGAIDFLASGETCEDDNREMQNQAAKAKVEVPSCGVANRLGLCTVETTETRDGIWQMCPLACGLCTVPPPPPPTPARCEDHDGRWATVVTPGAPTSCAQAATLNLCTSNKASIRSFVREACPLSCGECEAECEDNDAAFEIAGGSYETYLQSCAKATSARQWAGNLGTQSLCTSSNATIRTFVRQACKSSCGLCPGAGGRRLQLDDTPTTTTTEAVAVVQPRELQAAGKQVGQQAGQQLSAALAGIGGGQKGRGPSSQALTLFDGCIDPQALQYTDTLEVVLSEEVIVGAFALKRAAHVFSMLIPGALGLALGAGQGSALSKALLPSSRLPARVAAIIVGLSLPVVAALLGVLNQFLASHLGTLACLCILGMLGTWMPRGPLSTLLRAFTGQSVHGSAAAEKKGTPGGKAHPMIDPVASKAVVSEIGKRKWMVTGWMLLALFCVALYLGLSTAYSMVIEQLQETMRQIGGTVTLAQNRSNFGPLSKLIATALSTIFSVIAKTYLAQAFYTDAAVSTVVSIWHTEHSDDAETASKRAGEKTDVAVALGLGQLKARPAPQKASQDV